MKLHDYQKVAVSHLSQCPRGALFLDMGLKPILYSRVRAMTICPKCKSPFEQSLGKGKGRKYCRVDCGNTEKRCESCNKAFSAYPGQRFCSDPCRFLGMAKRNRSDPQAQTVRGRLGGIVRGKQLAAQAQYKGYLRFPGTNESTHRVIASQVLGRPLREGETVHHEDQIKSNNAPENLIVFVSQAQHARHHKLNHCGLPSCDCAGIRLKGVMPNETP